MSPPSSSKLSPETITSSYSLRGGTRCLALFLAASAALLFSPVAGAATVVSNLAEPVEGQFSVYFDSIDRHSYFQPFTTGSAAALFNSVTLDLDSITNSPSITVAITNGLESPPLQTLTGTLSPTTAGLYTYAPAAPFELDANTTYYVVVTNSTRYTSIGWLNTASTQETSSSGWSLGDFAYNSYNTDGVGQSTPTSTAYAARISIDATVGGVPEPARGTLLLLALTGVLFRRRRA